MRVAAGGGTEEKMSQKSNRLFPFPVIAIVVLLTAGIFLATSAALAASTPLSQTNGGVGTLTPRPYSAAADTDYGWFERFRTDNFSPATEPLLAQACGTQPAFQPEGDWQYSSYTSFEVAFSTTLPAITIVQYGTDSSYGEKTETEDAYYFNHLHYLKNLQPNTTYHYRLVAQTKDGVQILSGDRVFTTLAITGQVVRIPEDMADGAPYNLTVPNRTYLLTRDTAVDGTFVKIAADNVTIDLGGHTAIYDNAPALKSSGIPGIVHGQDIWHKRNVKIVNGVIKQGQRGSTASSPIDLTQFGFPNGNEIAGITVDYYGADTMGFNLNGLESLHHNVLIDRGTGVTNRHIGIQAVHTSDGKLGSATWNSLHRFRHQGIYGAKYVRGNELYCDSYDTNSIMINPEPNTEVRDNKLFGVGYMPVGLNSATNCYLHDNFVYLQGTANRQRSAEYARLSGLTGINFRLYNQSIDGYNGYIGEPVQNLRFQRNIVVLKPWENCNIARGIWFMTGDRSTNTVFRNNVVKVEALSDHLYDGNRWDMYVTCVDINGGTPPDDPNRLPPVTLLEDNTLISNVSFVSFGSAYGSGMNNVLLNRTKLEKIGHHTANYLPFTIGYWDWKSIGNKMLNTSAGPGVDLNGDPRFYGSGQADLTFWNTHGLRFVDQNGNPIINTSVNIVVSGSWSYRSTNAVAIPPGNVPETYDPRYKLTVTTGGDGAAKTDLLVLNHFMRNPQVAERVDYTQVLFSAEGYQDATAPMDALKANPQITLRSSSAASKTIAKPNQVWFHGISTTSIQMDYTNLAPEILEIHRATQQDGPYELVGKTDGAQQGVYVDAGLTPGQTYYYTARIWKSDGQVGPFSEPQAVTLQLPAANTIKKPNWLWFHEISTTSAQMNYTSLAPEVLEIHRAAQQDGPYELVGKTDGRQQGVYVDAGLTPGQTYYYVARICKSDGQVGPFSEPQTVTIQLPAVTWQWIRQGEESGNGYVFINWNSWYDVDWAYVLRATDVNGPYQNVDTLRMNTDYKGLVPTETQPYYYKLLPVKNGVEGKASEPVKIFFPK